MSKTIAIICLYRNTDQTDRNMTNHDYLLLDKLWYLGNSYLL